MTDSTSRVAGLPTFSRHITTHDSNGLAIFHTPDPEHPESSTETPGPPISTEPTWVNFPGSSGFGLGYATDTTPADFNANQDLDTYYDYLHQHPGIVIQGGSVLRVVDM
ncbi:uncharacterized protein A1O9_10822 [Exophiala aquamarina CBS 119918]|uniref:Uncharacterized protein n=1 Tax=Exophiala aquamarina CBS 119918 TaxID=1182545 RepID=A0A072NZ87_9EURO|nr:uncharacterized protein A1O9_10822 [Exophiala aquamarina CBS 119918]KEF52916.1 hypothetical protein A1O9_10822 [Exophiala aquamarina CBS 119918]